MPDDLGLRLSRSRTDLSAVVRQGPRPRAYLPGSDGLLLKGKRHLIAAPAKSGKSLATLAHAVEMALHGARVAFLDRENGGDEYGRRLGVILQARQLDASTAQLVTERIAHYEYPPLSLDAAHDASYAEALSGVDLVVFDSSRAFLTALDLDEDSSNDYSRFMAALIEPLHRAGVATLILDNAGHEGRRARGSSAKTDLNEIVFRLAQVEPFSEEREGLLRLERTHSRFGGPESWTMALGAGTYSAWTGRSTKREGQARELHDAVVNVLMDRGAVGVNALLDLVRDSGVRVQTAKARSLLKEWAEDPSSPVSRGMSGYSLSEPCPDIADMAGQVIPLDRASSR